MPASSAEAVTWLEALAAELARQGWTARLDTPPGHLPCLHTRDPASAGAPTERIYAQPIADGTWRYWWPWAEPIAADPAGAAEVITRALACTAPGRPGPPVWHRPP